MAGNEEKVEISPRGNEWEVVSLTQSAYDAAPSVKESDTEHVDVQEKLGQKNEAETSSDMFMSGHFVFPPNEHGNLPLKLEYSEIQDDRGSEYDASQFMSEEGKSDLKDEENVSIEGLIPDEFPEVPILDEKGNRLSVHGTNFDKEQIIYNSAEFSSIYSESTFLNSSNNEECEKTDESADNIDSIPDSTLHKLNEEDNNDDTDLPCEAWWKRRIVSLYTHAKEANTFWSICVAAAVMGLVIIGHRWQQERWQILHLKWQSTFKDERMGLVFSQVSRLKDIIVGGHLRGSLLRGSSSA